MLYRTTRTELTMGMITTTGPPDFVLRRQGNQVSD
jgi:hypothetical protein